MRRISSTLALLLACVAILPHGTANAQARGPDARAVREGVQARNAERAADPEIRAARLMELRSWLRHLEGRFNYEGTVSLLLGAATTRAAESGCYGRGVCYVKDDANGVGECTAIGLGSGMQCVTRVPWPRLFWPSEAATVGLTGEMEWKGPYLDFAVALFGIDRDLLGIRFLLVDGQSVAYSEIGELKGNTVTFEIRCGASCRRKFQIRVRSDGRLETRYELTTKGTVLAGYQFTLTREAGQARGRSSAVEER